MENNNSQQHLNFIDGLRGVAILLVTWFHFWQLSWLTPQFSIAGYSFYLDILPRFGFIGVDLFFFISGFCLMLPYAKAETAQLTPPSLAEFIQKRVRKIVPSFLLVLLVASFVLYLLNQLPTPFYKHFLAHLFFVQNWFDDTYSSINGVLWSLAVEVQFYVLFPFMIRPFIRSPGVSFSILFVIAMASRYLIQKFALQNAAHFLNQLPCVIDLFAFGMLSSLIYISCRRSILFREKQSQKITSMISFFFLVLIIALYTSGKYYSYPYEKLYAWQLTTRPLFGFLFSGLTLTTLFSNGILNKTIGNRVFLFFSAISYNLYLWHQWIAARLFELKIPTTEASDPHYDRIWQWKYFILISTLSVALSYVLTRFLERPFLKRTIRK